MSGVAYKPITVLDFCQVAAAIYGPVFGGPANPDAGNGFKMLGSSADITLTGFKGALYTRGNGRGLDIVAAICGTEGAANGGNDLISDAGYGETTYPKVAALAGPLAAPVLMSGAIASTFLRSQMRNAIALAERAKTVAANGGFRRAYITGHSLGGGLAQIAAAYTGLRACAFNPAACTGVGGVQAAYTKTGGGIVSFQIDGDPVNMTNAFGNWLGDRVILVSHRPAGGERHKLGPTVQELSTGPFIQIGARDPFSYLGTGVTRVQANSG